MGNIQLSGSVLSLPAVGPIPPVPSSCPYCPPTHAISITTVVGYSRHKFTDRFLAAPKPPGKTIASNNE